MLMDGKEDTEISMKDDTIDDEADDMKIARLDMKIARVVQSISDMKADIAGNEACVPELKHELVRHNGLNAM